MKIIFYAGIVILAAYALLFAYLSLVSKKDAQPGMLSGKLRPCPGTPNCVCSEYEGAWHVKPFDFDESPENAWSRLKAAITASGGDIKQISDNYIWCTYKTKIFRFTDDVEFRLDPGARRIELRSASRVGKGDLGDNKNRVEKLRQLFNTMNKQDGRA